MSRIALREVTPVDLPALYEHQADPVASAMAGFPSRDREAFEAPQARIAADPDTVTAAVEVDGELAGAVGSWPEDGRRLVGYGIDRARWGRGVASAGLASFVTDRVPERPLHAWVVPTNLGSRRVLEKNGFVLVETHEDEFLYELA